MLRQVRKEIEGVLASNPSMQRWTYRVPAFCRRGTLGRRLDRTRMSRRISRTLILESHGDLSSIPPPTYADFPARFGIDRVQALFMRR